ncbi:uncharacterized protein LOC131659327 [Vicia villosa]|uniref:uncharacterized protein LOC131659327 n=1 Tax=Vicia villosa TaxID=3911 RepID=UPI00273C9CFD|nr:uncharacterized protein LOC131659327 [Vicia villosa]
MDNNVTANQGATRRTHTYTFHLEGMVQLGQLGELVTGHNETVFSDSYGNILSLLYSRVDEWTLSTLLQFYDPDIRCLTFSDYQLAPTLEEYSHLLNIKVRRKVPFVCVPKKPRLDYIANALYLSLGDVHDNWKKNGDTHGFYMSFLIEKAQEFANKEMWEAFNALLAALIYGIVMFPNIHKFVDLAAICLFMGKNPVPTLLAGTYYSIHSRHGKRGVVRSCFPLLYNWFKSHLPASGQFITSTQKWSQRVMGLTANDIVWYQLRTCIFEVIIRCGNFGNVPLIGTRGCINYNPVLALRQLGYTMKSGPLDKEIHQSVYFEKGTDPVALEEIRKAWNNIHIGDKSTLGAKNDIAMEPYTDWVKERVKKLLLPFPEVPLLYAQPPKILEAMVPRERLDQVRIANLRLKEKDRDTDLKHYFLKQTKNELARELKTLKGESSQVRKRTRTEMSGKAAAILAEDPQKVIEKAVKEAEEKLKREYQEDLKAHKLRTMKKKLEEETTQRIAVETQLKGSHLRTARLTEENAKLRDQMMSTEDAPEKAYLPECKGCKELRESCKKLDGQLFRKDVVIQSFVK